jgi:hypothetical protein
MDAKQLVEALRLSDEERAALAGELIQSLEGEVDADAEAAWSAEIRARLIASTGTATTIPWSEARRRIHRTARRDPQLDYLESAQEVKLPRGVRSVASLRLQRSALKSTQPNRQSRLPEACPHSFTEHVGISCNVFRSASCQIEDRRI